MWLVARNTRYRQYLRDYDASLLPDDDSLIADAQLRFVQLNQ
jgi:hypothetical protein